MITPKTFYHPNDIPDNTKKNRMWNNIDQETRKRKVLFMPRVDTRSFFYGIAAAFLLYFASVGLVSTLERTLESTKPGVLRLDEAYQSAIEEFEKVVPSMTLNANASDRDRNYIALRTEQLKKIDTAIENFRREISGNDFSPLTQLRLRNLYSIKLRVLQEILNQGEIEL